MLAVGDTQMTKPQSGVLGYLQIGNTHRVMSEPNMSDYDKWQASVHTRMQYLLNSFVDCNFFPGKLELRSKNTSAILVCQGYYT